MDSGDKYPDRTVNRVRVWIVQCRFEDNSPHVRLVYATKSGHRYFQERCLVYRRGADLTSTVTAAKDVEIRRLETVTDRDTCERYAQLVRWTQNQYAPTDIISRKF